MERLYEPLRLANNSTRHFSLGLIYLMASSMVMTQCVSQIDNCLVEEGKSILAIDSPKYNSPTFLLIEKLTKDQADMNAARSVRPLTAAANVNKNAAYSKREVTRKACIFVNASAFARRCQRPDIHAASAPHVGIPTRVLYGQVFR
ncbi:MAG: hypothetical protein J5741_03470 [Bacteroidales bacterium]|nr:hypothetical protein [Bacteroidales bacterium]